MPRTIMRIGRTPDNDISLPEDLGVSRYHAELRELAPGRYEIVDLNSHNGTFVNGQRVSRVALDDHDVIGVGNSTFCLAAG
jgi:pSer/pThr/pTyr-binding forkhead associated (FHA) protein